jgi:hypothetical protein
MPSIVLRLQFTENGIMSQKLITEIRSAVISVEKLNLQGKTPQAVFVNVVYTHNDPIFPDGSFDAEIILKKKTERTKNVLDQLAKNVYDTICSVLNHYEYHGFFGRVRTITFHQDEEGYISSKSL